MLNEKVLVNTIKKEKLLIETLKKLGLVAQDGSPLDVSYLNECFAVSGIPQESDLSEYKKTWDPLINTYVSMIHGDVTVEKGIKTFKAYLKGVKLEPYSPKNNKVMIKSYLQKEQRVFSALKVLGSVESGDLKTLADDWDLAYVLLGKTGDEVSTGLLEVVEMGKKPDSLLKMI